MSSMVVFTDLDGCFLNEDYTYQESLPVLNRLKSYNIPVVLVSSKTEAEMSPLVQSLELESPFVCENGGVIAWNQSGCHSSEGRTILGVPRQQILNALVTLKHEFNFRSFSDLGVEGISHLTGLDRRRAGLAAQRFTNEPLVWDDDETRIDDFRQSLEGSGLTLTRGGRFWHVAGSVDKGVGVQRIVQLCYGLSDKLLTVSVGDSPIDLPMLEQTDVAILIPQPSMEFRLTLNHPRIYRAACSGARGWAEGISQVLEDYYFNGNHHG
jgi:mannosyl-3-phosphoglycerate phosphatase